MIISSINDRKISGTHQPHGALIFLLVLRSLMFLAFSFGAANMFTKPLWRDIFMPSPLSRPRTRFSPTPVQPDRLRYNQMIVTAMTNVIIKIVASSSIFISSKLVRLADPSNDSATPIQVKTKSLKGDFVVTGTPYATFPCQKFSGIKP